MVIAKPKLDDSVRGFNSRRSFTEVPATDARSRRAHRGACPRRENRVNQGIGAASLASRAIIGSSKLRTLSLLHCFASVLPMSVCSRSQNGSWKIWRLPPSGRNPNVIQICARQHRADHRVPVGRVRDRMVQSSVKNSESLERAGWLGVLK
jgi:hypothetical protein